MAEVIVIDDDSPVDDEEGESEEKSSNIMEMNKLTERLKVHFSSCSVNIDEGITKWRMKLNPFRIYGFLYQSKYACKDLNSIDLPSSLAKGDVPDDKISSINGDSMAVEVNKEATCDTTMKISQKVTEDISDAKCDNLCCSQGASPVKISKDEVGINYEKSDDEVDFPPQNINLSVNVNEAINNEQGNSHCSEQKEAPNKSSEVIDLDNKLPYYLKNFMHIVMTVLKSDDKRLFNQYEIECLQNFVQISDSAKKLYIRLYQRKRDWFRCDKIHYPKIVDDLTLPFKELVDFGYMHDENSLVDFDEICNLLTALETRNLADDIKLKVSNTKNNSKADLIKLLKKHCQTQRTIFMTKSNSMKSILSKGAKKFIGKCVKVKEEQRFLFTRAILLFCLTTAHFEDLVHNITYGTSILYQMLLINLGDVKYPSFKLNKKNDIFPSREHLIDYAYAVELEKDFEFAVDKKDYKAAMTCYVKVRPQLLLVLENFLSLDKDRIHCLQLPRFLSSFSKEYVTLRLANKCVDILEKERNYPEAVSLIELLLTQRFMRFSSRGFLWERLILDYERYIKDFDKTYLFTVEALKDPYLRTGHRLNILQRHNRLDKSPKVKSSIKGMLIKSFKEEITEPNEETIRTKIFLESSAKNRAVFLSQAIGDNYNLSNVEQHVITHYQTLGFPSGKHGEGSSVTTLFYLLFWDIIFMDVTDAFQSEFQNSPLDMFHDNFFLNREDALNERLNFVYHASEDNIRAFIEQIWKQNHGTYSDGLNWELFQNEMEAGDLAVCIGNKVLGGICELFCKDLRRRKGGFPDLIVWNAEKKTCKIIEVKGPGDKLSLKQIVWLDVLSYLGADAFACYVTGVGGKRKRTSAD